MNAIVIIFGIVLPILLLIGGGVALFYFLYWAPKQKSKNKVDNQGYRHNYTINHGDFINQLRGSDSETKNENVK